MLALYAQNVEVLITTGLKGETSMSVSSAVTG